MRFILHFRHLPNVHETFGTILKVRVGSIDLNPRFESFSHAFIMIMIFIYLFIYFLI